MAKLDQELILTALSGKITESLTTNWNDEWCPSVEMFGLHPVLPVHPDQYVTPYLNRRDTEESLGRNSKTAAQLQGLLG